MHMHSVTLLKHVASLKLVVVSSSRFVFLCLSQKVPPKPRYLWTQLSSVDSTSVDTDYEQYDPSTDPSVPFSTFQSEIHSLISSPFVFILVCFWIFASWDALAVFLHFAVEAVLQRVCTVCTDTVCTEYLQDGFLIKTLHRVHHSWFGSQILSATELTQMLWWGLRVLAASLRKVSHC